VELGSAYLAAGNYAKAEAAFTDALERAPQTDAARTEATPASTALPPCCRMRTPAETE
jgi:Tfp pilus assembly protein PilF